jgi:RNA polymerase sigma factor (sigma-70 family)
VTTADPRGELLSMLTREERFNLLHERHFEAIRRYAFRRSPALADDIVSETFLVAWRRFEDVPDDARPWLFGVARNVRLNLQRSSRRQDAVAERLIGELPASAETEADALGDAVEAALSTLSERDREILLLDAWEGLNRREIAAVLRCSVANVSVRLHRARARFEHALVVDPRNSRSLFPLIDGGASDVV